MLNSRIHDMAKELGKTCIYNFQFAIHVPGRVWGGTAFAKRSEAMKAPVGLLSGSAVCDSRWRGLAPTSSHNANLIAPYASEKIAYGLQITCTVRTVYGNPKYKR